MNNSKDHYLTDLLIYLKTNPKSFSESIGYNRADKIYHILKFRNGVSSEVAKDICKIYNDVNYDWLLTGEGEMLNTNAPKVEANTNNEKSVPYFIYQELKEQNERLLEENAKLKLLLEQNGIDVKKAV